MLGLQFDRPPGTDATATAPSAQTKLRFFVQIAAPLRSATLPALPFESPLRRWPLHSTATTTNTMICGVTRALAFPLQGTANPDGPGTTGLGGCSLPIPGVARPPSIIPHSILCTPFARSLADLARIRSS
ncbi:hypothetical protein EVAR_21751_1 [Eumeta japonica]|uniref:Uncharacterized protein n=1 Tax=Eumeta variegata TaxID=151549 RepID=A0A4C1ZMV1_EUMVA|nr:hypothetical protein EVAR_21751_1 [Eumeta japonica]